MTGAICRVVTPKDKERYSSPGLSIALSCKTREYYFYLKGFLNVNVRWSVIYLLYRLSQYSYVITELPRWRVGHFDVSSVMPLIKSYSRIYSDYEDKLFMERYIIYNNWHRKSCSTLHFLDVFDEFSLMAYKTL